MFLIIRNEKKEFCEMDPHVLYEGSGWRGLEEFDEATSSLHYGE
jgi:hypothetical protein